MTRRRLWILLVGISCLAVFLLHFRPWEGGLVEDWQTWAQWADLGWLGAQEHSSLIEQTGRPLHFVFYYLGLSLSGGGWIGPWLMLGVVAVAQLLVTLWALRPLNRSPWLRLALAVLVALHPLWGVGYILRFFPSQVMTLALLTSVGMLIRYLSGRHWRFLLGSALVQIYGLLTYQAGAVVWIIGAVALAVTIPSSVRRRLLAVGTTIAASALAALYSIVIAPMINPHQYEAVVREDGGGFVSLHAAVVLLYNTVLEKGPLVAATIAAIVVLAAVAQLTGRLPARAAWTVAGLALIAPLSGIAYINSVAWLGDPDRVANTAQLTLFVALFTWFATAREGTREVVVSAIAVASSVALAFIAIHVWSGYSQLQQQLLSEIKDTVQSTPDDETVLVMDHTGLYGNVYTFYPPHLAEASRLTFKDRTPVVLCTTADAPARTYAPSCTDLHVVGTVSKVTTITTVAGRIDLAVVKRVG